MAGRDRAAHWGQRDDLRIEGFAPESDGDGPRRVVLWTVEVKVQAYFHASTDQTGGPPAGNSDETDDDETPMVNQLVNYDAWLEGQVADHKAGFVLAIPDHAGDLPEGLTQKWACTTWTRLGNTVRQALEGNALPESEAEWAKHLLGFIRTHLWSASEMADTQLTLDHVAFLRANWFLGAETERIVDDLVASLEPVLAESGLGLGQAPTPEEPLPVDETVRLLRPHRRRRPRGLVGGGLHGWGDPGLD